MQPPLHRIEEELNEIELYLLGMNAMSYLKNSLLMAGAIAFLTPAVEAATRLDNHSGLQFTSGGVDYIGLWLLEHED